jgi:hypothetical protein
MALSDDADLFMESAEYAAWLDHGEVVICASGKTKELARVPIEARQLNALDDFVARAIAAARSRLESFRSNDAGGGAEN